MLLETSFCGPKPLDTDLIAGVGTAAETVQTEELEQIILARKYDVTRAIVAEGIEIDTSTPKKTIKSSNGQIKSAAKVTIKKLPEMTVTKTSTTTTLPTRRPDPKTSLSAKKVEKKIVGVTPEGTQYFRIKLKPDHLYDDKGVASNEKVIEECEAAKKPATLSLGRDGTKKAAPHYSQLVQEEKLKKGEHLLTPNASPKPSRASGSRSPSPATVNVSRKSSFCSLFKSKDVTASPESPTGGGQRKRSAISMLLDSPRDRSRSKSRESDRSSAGGVSANSTPSKQRSVLAIFKPRRGSSKSKSSSPVDPHMMNDDASTSATHRSRKQTTTAINDIPSDKPRLRYYEPTNDSNGIYIPLHTPPEEKENAFSSHYGVTPPKATTVQSQPQQQTQIIGAKIITIKQIPRKTDTEKITTAAVTPKATPTTSASATVGKSLPKGKKSYRIELPDGSIRIPLRTPSDERTEPEAIESSAIEPEPQSQSQWSTAVQRNSSQESQDTVISSQAPSLSSTDIRSTQKQVIVEVNPIPPIETPTSIDEPVPTIPPPPTTETPPSVESKASPASKQSSQEDNGVVEAPALKGISRERKRILFSTKIGSGSEEQIFATQLSLSKTESLSSQLSEQVSCNLESPTNGDTKEARGSDKNSMPVKMRSKDETRTIAEEKNNTNRHSMYIENIDEIMETQKRIETDRKNSLISDPQMIVREEVELPSADVMQKLSHSEASSAKPRPPEKPERHSKSASSSRREDRPRTIVPEHGGGVSSESEHESELESKHHRLPRTVGTVEEESAGLVAQESFDEELPYIPTTLPEERSIGVTIIPVKDRALMEVKMCPTERPRSTTPMNPSFLEEYCGTMALTDDYDHLLCRGEKLRISLPRKEIRSDAVSAQRARSPRRTSNASAKSWFEFAEQDLGAQTICSPSNSQAGVSIMCSSEQKGGPAHGVVTTEWIDFDKIPEKRKPAKRITTLPHKDSATETVANVQYNYVNPDECQCECHGADRDCGAERSDSERKESVGDEASPDDCVPLLESDQDDLTTPGNR